MGLLYRADAVEIGLLDSASTSANVSWGQIYFSLAALAYLLVDLCGKITDEYAYIWRLRLGLTKLIYMAVRYLSVAFQAVMFAMSVKFQLTIGIYTIYVLTYVYNARRTYHLFLRSRVALILLSIAGVTEALISLVLVPMSINQLVFNAYCNSTNVPSTVFVLLLAKVLSQVTMWSLIYYKSPHRNRPSMDGSAIGNTWLRFSIYVVFLVCLPISAFKQQFVRPDFMFSWPMTMWSYSTCTSIIDDQKEIETLLHTQNDSSSRAFMNGQLLSSSTSNVTGPSTDVSCISDLPQVTPQSSSYGLQGVTSAHVPTAPGEVLNGQADEDPEHSSRESVSVDLGDRSDVMSTVTGSLADDEWSLDDRIEIGSMHSCSTSDTTFDYKTAWARSASVLSA